MALATTTITEVTRKETSKGDLFLVQAGGQEYSTMKLPLAAAAKGLIGKQVELEYKETTKVGSAGQVFTNRYLDDVRLATTQIPFAPTVSSGAAIAWPSEASGSDKEGRIMRQSAAKVAVHLLPHLPAETRSPASVIAMADFFFDYFVNGPAGPVEPLHPETDAIPF